MTPLVGRHEPGVPRSKRLLSDAGSNVLVRVCIMVKIVSDKVNTQ